MVQKTSLHTPDQALPPSNQRNMPTPGHEDKTRPTRASSPKRGTKSSIAEDPRLPNVGSHHKDVNFGLDSSLDE